MHPKWTLFFSTSQCLLSPVYNPLISCITRTTLTGTSFIKPFFLSNFYALPTPGCPLSHLFCFCDFPTRVRVSVIQCSNQKTSRLCLCRSYNQIVCYPVHDSYVVIPPLHSLALLSRTNISRLSYTLTQHPAVLISHNPNYQQYHTHFPQYGGPVPLPVNVLPRGSFLTCTTEWFLTSFTKFPVVRNLV